MIVDFLVYFIEEGELDDVYYEDVIRELFFEKYLKEEIDCFFSF